MLDVNEAALLVHRSPETVRRWVWSGKLVAHRDGRKLMVSQADLVRLVGAEGIADAPSLSEWAAAARRALITIDRTTVGSAADLVLTDRRQRSGSPLDH